MPYDYSDAPPPRELELILLNTVATLSLHILGGGAGEDGMLKLSKDGRCKMLVVCRQSISDSWLGNLRECLAHLV